MITIAARARRSHAALAGALLLLATPVARGAESRVALVVGCQGYAARPLANPERDARAMAQALQRCGFEVLLGLELDRAGLKTMVERFRRALSEGSTAVFYFSGHGVQSGDENYVVPVRHETSSSLDLATRCVSVSSVLEAMESAGTAVKIVILDACRDAGIAASLPGNRGLVLMPAPVPAATGGVPVSSGSRGTLIAFATAPRTTAGDGDGPHSPYTAALLRALPTPGLSVADLLMEVRRDVMLATAGRQVPWESTSFTSAFYFVPPATGGNGARPPLPHAMLLLGDGESGKWRARSLPDGCTMVWVPNGDSGFWMDEVETTNRQFARFVESTGYVTTAERIGGSRVFDASANGGNGMWITARGATWRHPAGPTSVNEPEHPVVHTSFADAQAYCQWAGKQLPRESEWQRAARGIDQRRFPWGAGEPRSGSFANALDLSAADLAPFDRTLPGRLAYIDSAGDIFVVDDARTAPVRLTSNARAVGYPRVSSDGRTVLFVVNDRGIHAIDAIPGSPTRRLPAAGAQDDDTNPVWSPDGKTIAFQRVRSATIHLMDADGSNARLLCSGVEPAWLPDGRRLAYVPANGESRLLIKDLGSTHATLVTSIPLVSDPQVSPDGRSVAFLARGGQHVFVAPLRGGEPVRVTTFPAQPAWLPDGSGLSLFPLQGRRAIEVLRPAAPAGQVRRLLDFGGPHGWQHAPGRMRSDDGFRFTAAVGSFPAGASPLGVLDLAGNVREWCADGYAPTGKPQVGPFRVVKGGSWLSPPEHLEIDHREGEAPDVTDSRTGFRGVRRPGAQ